jgi:hypothetical protein
MSSIHGSPTTSSERAIGQVADDQSERRGTELLAIAAGIAAEIHFGETVLVRNRRMFPGDRAPLVYLLEGSLLD